MKQTVKKAMAIFIAIVMILGAVGNIFSVKTSAAKITECEVGDIIEFGSYPQSEVSDEALITALNVADGKWISYGYYSGTGGEYDGQMKPGDYMRYKDVMYGSDKYRGVVFDTYRPRCVGYETTTSGSDTNQDDNGYIYGNVYWFKYEPIEWRVLDPAVGMVMAETILDSQAYNNYVLKSDSYIWGDSTKTYYANNYAESSIRKWLNEDFYNTAFSIEEQGIIEYTTLDNSSMWDSAYDSVSTNDKIYLLTYGEVNKKYVFSTLDSRKAQSSDYAKCQGLWCSTSSSCSGNSSWWLRSSGFYCNDASYVTAFGEVPASCGTEVYRANFGVRPALNLKLSSEIFVVTPETTTRLEETTTIASRTTTVAVDASTTKADITTTIIELTATLAPSQTKYEGKDEENEVTTTKKVPITNDTMASIEIRRPSQTEITYGDIMILRANIKGNLPKDTRVIWTANNDCFKILETTSNGTSCVITPASSGDTLFVASIVDGDGKVIDSATQTMTSKADFFTRIIAFFKKLFGLTKIIPETLNIIG